MKVMKKAYSKPQTDTVKVELTQMIALSMVEGTANSSDALSHGNGFWDDEDFDEEGF